MSIADRLELVLRAKRGDQQALAQYVELNRGLLCYTVRRYQRWAVDQGDLHDMEQEGMLGLIRGIAKFDPEKSPGKAPECYIFSWVKAYVSNYARAHGVGSTMKFVYEETRSTDNEHERNTVDEIEDETEDLDTKYHSKELRAVIDGVVKKLLPKERIIARRRLFQEDPDTLEEVGADMGVSRERVRQIEIRIKEKVKFMLTERLQNQVSF